MKLAEFILANLEPILVEWEAFAKSLPPGASMTSRALRNDAERMLRFVADDVLAEGDRVGGPGAELYVHDQALTVSR